MFYRLRAAAANGAVAVSVLALAAGWASAALQKRTVSQILTDISTISNDTTTLLGALNAYTGDIGTSVPIQHGTDAVINAINVAVADARNTPTYNLTDGLNILTKINTLTNLTYQSLNVLVAKHGLFSAAGLNDLVAHDLDVLHEGSNELANALYDITPKDVQGLAYSAGACLDQAFSTARMWSSVPTSCSYPTPTKTISPAPFPTQYGAAARDNVGGILVVTLVAVLVPIL